LRDDLAKICADMNRRIVLPPSVVALMVALIWKTSGTSLASHGRSQLNPTGLSCGFAQRPSSSAPSDADIFHSRVFPEPLVPIGRRTSPQENVALKAAIDTDKARDDQDDHSAILGFLEQYPNSAWRAALLTNLGLEYRRTGWFLKALDAWEQAWASGKGEKSLMGKVLIDHAVGELAELNARLGRRDRVEAILKEIDGRPLIGPATEKITAAREGVWMMYNEPGNAFKCGPFALDRIRASQHPSTAPDPKILAAQSTNHGMSLDQVWKLSADLGMNYQMARREPGSDVIVPSVVNWKANHYAALIREDRGRFLVQDPTFGDPIRVSKAALDSESTGYFLIPSGQLPKGWQKVGAEEARQVWGMGNTGDHDPTGTKGIDDKAKPICPWRGMAQYNFHTQVVSLNIMDTPVGYSPPRGPDMHFTITYNQRELSPTTIHSHSNFGSKWVCNWIAWVDGDPTVPPTDAVRIFLPGGGSELHTVSSGTFSTDPQSGATLTVFPDPTTGRFERNLPDGSKQVFELRDYFPFNHSSSVYLTRSIDPAGNTTHFNYDGNFRLTSVVDALNQTTTVRHLSNDSAVLPDFFLISQITDPFGRLATFDYQNGQLIRIHDTIGITSQFGYDAGTDFISSMTTPYGTTTFSQPPSSLDATTSPPGNARVIQAVDPTGAVERLEYGHQAPGISDSQPDVPVVPGVNVLNTSYEYRNSFYWDKRATAMYPPDQNGVYDFTKAKLTQWLHTSDSSSASNIKEREKMPLENAVYYFYSGQQDTRFVGDNGFPTKIARVMDDGTTQLWQYAYNSIGNVIKAIDPVGRVASYVYDTNNIDLLRVYQRSPQGVSTDPDGSAANKVASYTYNSLHEPLTATDAGGQTTTYTYNAYGQILTRKNAKNETTTFGYGDGSTGHPSGYLTSATSPPSNGSSAVTSFTYDNANRVRTVTNSPDNYTVTSDYDNLDRVTQITYPDGTNQQFQYTQDFGQGLTNILDLTRSKDRRNLWTTRHYNSNRQMDSITDPLGRQTFYGWCTCGSLTSITDPRSKTTIFDRDLENRVTSKRFADNTSTTYVYENTTSRLKSMTDALNQTTNYQHLLDDNLQQISYTGALHTTPAVSFAYDPNYNRIISMTDGTGITNYGYFAVANPPTLGAGQLQSVDGPLLNDTISYNYDELGRATTRSVNGASNAVTWAFDSLGRTSSEANKLGAFAYAYDSVTNRLSKMTYPSGQSSAYTYFPNAEDKRLQEIKGLTSRKKLISQFDYTYDADGQILSWTQDNPSLSRSQRYDFGYDNADQLLTAPLRDTSRKNTLIKQFTYAYDFGANRTSEQVGSVTTAAVPNDVNEIVSQSGGTNRTLTYDLNGNLINDGSSRTFEWDAANRLLVINYTGTSNRTEFTYDGLSRRLKIVEKNGSVVTGTKQFVWNGSSIAEERDANNNVTRRFYGQGEQISATSYFYARDHLGSVRELTDGSGVVQTRYDYDPYGRRTKISGSLDATFGFTGHYYHAASSLHLALYRAYDTDLGRWLNRDRIGETAGTNLYAYVSNDVGNAVDPDGLLTLLIHGTYSSPQTFSTGFRAAAGSTFGETPVAWQWSGGNSDLDRHAAGLKLARYIKAYQREHPCEPINIVAHSHGGNVAYIASRWAQIDTLVTLGTPFGAYMPVLDNIGQLINVYSGRDYVQVNGGNAYSIGGQEFGTAGRTAPAERSVTNVQVTTKTWGIPAHSELLSPAVWNQVFPEHE
jgi:RHS repeat-associated protein